MEALDRDRSQAKCPDCRHSIKFVTHRLSPDRHNVVKAIQLMEQASEIDVIDGVDAMERGETTVVTDRFALTVRPTIRTGSCVLCCIVALVNNPCCTYVIVPAGMFIGLVLIIIFYK